MSIDISRYIGRLRDKLDRLVDEFREYDFTFKPLLTQQEFEDQVLPCLQEALQLDNRYLVVYNVFNNLVFTSLADFNKVLCIVDFMVNLAKHDTATFGRLPNDVVKDLQTEDIFVDLKKYLFNKERMEYEFEGAEPLTGGNRWERVLRRPKPRVVPATISAIEDTILSKRSAGATSKKPARKRRRKRRVVPKAAVLVRPPAVKTRQPQFRNKKMKMVIEPDLEFVYESLNEGPQFEPEEVSAGRAGFVFKAPQYRLFAKYDPECTSAANLDALFNSFMQQVCKRAGKEEFNEGMPFLHESEYQYILEHKEAARQFELPPLVFEYRLVKLLKRREDGKLEMRVTRRKMKSTKVKHLSVLKSFADTEDYLAHCRGVVRGEGVKKRMEWVNSLMTDGRGLYSCDKLDVMVSIMSENPMLVEETDDSSVEEEEPTREEDEEKEDGETDEELQDGEKDEGIEDGEKDENQSEIAKDGDDELEDREKEDEKTEKTTKDEDEEIQEPTKEEDEELQDGQKDEELQDGQKEPSKDLQSIKKEELDLDDDVEDKDYSQDEENEDSDTESHDVPATLDSPLQPPELADEPEEEEDPLFAKPPKDDRKQVVTSARGIKMSTAHLLRHLSVKDFLRILANLIFPGMKVANRMPNSVVMSAVNNHYSKIYMNFRPYLIEMFLADLEEFFTMPAYFKLDSMLFELQIERLRDKRDLSKAKRNRV